MVILGIDPGTARMGWGVLRLKTGKDKLPAIANGKAGDPKKMVDLKLLSKHLDLLGYGSIVTEKEDGVGKRLGILRKELKKLIIQHKPDIMAVERLFFGMNAKTIIAVGQATGIVMLAAEEQGIPVIEYTGLQVKLMVAGHGRADKKVLQTNVRRIFGIDNLSFKGKAKGWDDASNALAIALCHILR